MIFFLVDLSTATEMLTTKQLRELQAAARATNAELQVTGALLYHDGSFMQVLEGDEGIVRSLYDRIVEDPRHHSLEVVTDGQTRERQFGDWSMAFRNLDVSEDDLAEGFSAFMQSRGNTFGDRPTVAQRLLLSFRRSLTVLDH